jgi:nicotinate-nucleotide adenylyltransferase
MKIGILGGTFNPPHIGHLILAQEVKEKAGLDKVLFIPTNIPPHKESYNVDAHHRINMVKLAIAGNKDFAVSDIEIKRGGISYTIDTVRELKTIYPQAKFYLIAGSDLANAFPTWKYFDQLRRAITIIVVRRKEYPLKNKDQFPIINVFPMGIASSKIRNLVKQGLSIRYLVNDKIAGYIKQHKLYTK